VALGGTLYQDIPSERRGALEHRPDRPRDFRSHRIRLEVGSRVSQALGGTELTVNSSHHQAIWRLAPGLLATGWSDDGLIEAVESPVGAPWVLAVQWHPEEMYADHTAPERGLFASLALEAERVRSGSVGERGKEDAVADAVQRAP
jgi:putative glutamine amidotransferase